MHHKRRSQQRALTRLIDADGGELEVDGGPDNDDFETSNEDGVEDEELGTYLSNYESNY